MALNPQERATTANQMMQILNNSGGGGGEVNPTVLLVKYVGEGTNPEDGVFWVDGIDGLSGIWSGYATVRASFEHYPVILENIENIFNFEYPTIIIENPARLVYNVFQLKGLEKGSTFTRLIYVSEEIQYTIRSSSNPVVNYKITFYNEFRLELKDGNYSMYGSKAVKTKEKLYGTTLPY